MRGVVEERYWRVEGERESVVLCEGGGGKKRRVARALREGGGGVRCEWVVEKCVKRGVG
jgi:hypothetical protein